MVDLDLRINYDISEKIIGLKEFKGSLETSSKSTVNITHSGLIAVGIA